MSNKLHIFVILMNLILITSVFYINEVYNLTVQNISMIALIISVYILIVELPIKKGQEITYTFLCVYIACLFGRGILKYGFDFTPTTWFYDSFNVYNEIEIILAFLLAIYSLIGIHTGIQIFRFRNHNTDVNYVVSSESKINTLKTTGWILFIIAIIPSMYLYLANFRNQNSDLLSQDSMTLAGMLSGLMLPFFIIMIATYKSKWPYIISLIYFIPQLLWGGRGRPTIMIIIVSFIYYRFVYKEKLKLSKKILIFIFSIGILNLFVVIKELRKYPINEWISELPSIYVDTFVTSNPLFEVIYEIGVALVPTAAVIRLVPDDISLQYGKTILYSVSTAIPDLFNVRPDFMSIYGNIPSLVSSTMGASFGGSILQDFYVNFMWLTPLLLVLIGILIARYSNYVGKSNNIVVVSFLIISLFPILWWPRSSLGFLFRYTFVTTALPLFIYFILSNFNSRKGGQ